MGEEQAEILAAEWCGPPLPKSVTFDGGFELKFSPKEIVKTDGRGALPTFARAFPHGNLPARRGASKAAKLRATADGHIYPATTYEAEAILWKGWKWRQLSAVERADVHMVPRASLEVFKGAEPSRPVSYTHLTLPTKRIV